VLIPLEAARVFIPPMCGSSWPLPRRVALPSSPWYFYDFCTADSIILFLSLSFANHFASHASLTGWACPRPYAGCQDSLPCPAGQHHGQRPAAPCHPADQPASSQAAALAWVEPQLAAPHPQLVLHLQQAAHHPQPSQGSVSAAPAAPERPWPCPLPGPVHWPQAPPLAPRLHLHQQACQQAHCLPVPLPQAH